MAFFSNKSCLTNLLEFLEYVTDAVDQDKPVDVIYLDFQKAFDKVPHQRLGMLKSFVFENELCGLLCVWNPHYQFLIEKLDKVQKRATKLP